MNNTVLLVVSIGCFLFAGILFLLQSKKLKVKNKKLIHIFNQLYSFLATKKVGSKLESIRIRIYNNTFGED